MNYAASVNSFATHTVSSRGGDALDGHKADGMRPTEVAKALKIS